MTMETLTPNRSPGAQERESFWYLVHAEWTKFRTVRGWLIAAGITIVAISAFGPDARWGAPDGPGEYDCRNRDQVIAWWARARAGGVRAKVTEVTVGPGKLLVGLDVTGTEAADEAGGTAQRWQVLTVSGDRITDIRGFDNRPEAAARAGVPA